MFTSQGHIPVPGGTVWYGVCGDLSGGQTPLIVVHGGPGMSHDYLTPLADLADARPVIFYDQLDAGLSERPNDPANWTVARFLDELDAVRAGLDLTRCHVFGNSWGGTLAAAYAATRPVGLESVVLSSPLIHTDIWIADNAAYRDALPSEVLDVMTRHEARGDTDHPDYQAAVEVFYKRHLCRSDPWPDCVNRTFETMNETCYAGMWGPNEFTCNGVLGDYDGRSGLSRIIVPTLVTCGAFDEATPDSTRGFAQMIPNAVFEVFENASHMAFVECRARYIQAVRAFLDHL